MRHQAAAPLARERAEVRHAANRALFDRHVATATRRLQEKVRTNLVRPTSYVKEILADTTVTGYRGPLADAGPLKGSDWEAYIRVMPHAEYPSGSSCICRAFVNALGVAEGFDVSETLKLDTNPVPLVQPVAAGSSTVEPGKTPETDLVLAFESWDEVVRVCGDSRLDGGMHFSASVPNGEELCAFAGDKAGTYARVLESGVVPPNAPDINHLILSEADTRHASC